MSTNEVYNYGTQFSAVCSQPATPVSGDPVLVGQIPGVALTAERADGTTTIKTDGVHTFSVKGETTTDAAVAVGDIVYYDSAATPHKLNRDSSNGVRFGYALQAVDSGATTTIQVKLGY
jgi:predicted RecA/RadA family phage recombinase